MFILGIHTGHNATVALMTDGTIIACASEERFTGKKNYQGYPAKSIEWVLRFGNISSADLDEVALIGSFGAPVYVGEEPREKPVLIRLMALLWKPAGWVRKSFDSLAYRFSGIRPIGLWFYNLSTDIVGTVVAAQERKDIAQKLGISQDRVKLYEHHSCHAYTAAWASPYSGQDQLVLTLDGEGDKLCATVNVFRNGRLDRISSTPLGNSIGQVYRNLTRYLGMKEGEHEYKVMGLAPYAKPENVDRVYKKIEKLVWLDPKNPLKHRGLIDTHQSYRFMREKLERCRFDDIAGAFQRLVEELLCAWVKEAVRHTGIRTLAVSGGVFMNVKANQKIAELPEVDRLFATPTCGDESNQIGAGYQAYLGLCRQRGIHPEIPPFDTLYWGPEFTDQEIADFLEKGNYSRRYHVEHVPEIEQRMAQILAKGGVLARLSGRMEWGARSLGNRSILAHPSDPDTIRIINEYIKNRDFWMPFAPSILAERAADYVVNPKGIPARFMAVTFDSTPLARRELKAAMHPYDFTLRPQLVDSQMNPGYHRMIREFEKLTGIGAVLNTSFNLHGEPVVLGPAEALKAFEESGLPHLAMGHYLISKAQPKL